MNPTFTLGDIQSAVYEIEQDGYIVDRNTILQYFKERNDQDLGKFETSDWFKSNSVSKGNIPHGYNAEGTPSHD